MEQEVKISEITIEICNRLNVYRNFVKNDMMIGDTKIIEGIDLVERFIREINPTNIEEDIENKLLFLLENYRMLKESKMKVINNYVSFGIDNSYNIVTMYLKEKKRSSGKSRVLVNN